MCSSDLVATRLGQPAINLLPRALLGEMALPDNTATVGARTEHVHLTKANGKSGGLAGAIQWIEHLGDQNHLHVTLDGAEIVTLADPDSGLAVGDAVAIELARPLFFAANGQRIAG